MLDGNKRRSLPDFLQAGLWSGLLVGFILAFAESIAVLIGAGPFLADGPFFVKAVALNGLAGALLGGLLAPLVLILAKFVFKKEQNAIGLCFPLYLAGGLFSEILIYLLDTYAYGGRNKGSLRTIGIIFLTAAVCFFLALALRSGISNHLARKWTFLFSPRWNLPKIAAVFGLVIGLGFFYWCSGRISIANEKMHIGAKRSVLKSPAPNLILLVVDSLRADHMSSNGYQLQTSPYMDLLAGNGAAFPATVASSSWTLPTHASLFTGLYPSSHGAYSVFFPLGAEYPTLAEILARSGYYALSVYANPLLGNATGLDRGFDRALGVGNRQKTSLTIERLYRKISGRGSTSGEILDISLRWIAHCRKFKIPYFIFLNILEAHAPYRPKEPYFREFCRDISLEKVQWSLIREATAPMRSRQERLSSLARFQDADLAVLSRLYDSNIRFVDQQIKTWADKLKEDEELDRSLLVITSDHGEFLGEHAQLEHRTGQLYNPVLQIPLIFYFPQKLAARKEQRFISQVDVFPSILSLLNLADQIPSGIQGANLFSGGEQKPVMAEFWDERKRSFVRAFYGENLKLIQEGNESFELYDLAKDPQEKTNLVQSQPKDAARLADELERFLASLRHQEPRPDEKKKKAIERLLKSLGYIK
jgi:arylsulfatase A-like enzyme